MARRGRRSSRLPSACATFGSEWAANSTRGCMDMKGQQSSVWMPTQRRQMSRTQFRSCQNHCSTQPCSWFLPSHAQFEAVDLFAVRREENSSELVMVAQQKEGRASVSNHPRPQTAKHAYWMRGSSTQNAKMKDRWFLPSQSEIETFLGPSLAAAAPGDLAGSGRLVAQAGRENVSPRIPSRPACKVSHVLLRCCTLAQDLNTQARPCPTLGPGLPRTPRGQCSGDFCKQESRRLRERICCGDHGCHARQQASSAPEASDMPWSPLKLG